MSMYCTVTRYIRTYMYEYVAYSETETDEADELSSRRSYSQCTAYTLYILIELQGIPFVNDKFFFLSAEIRPTACFRPSERIEYGRSCVETAVSSLFHVSKQNGLCLADGTSAHFQSLNSFN